MSGSLAGVSACPECRSARRFSGSVSLVPNLLRRLRCVCRAMAADEGGWVRRELPYEARRRSEAWRKHTHRHRERLTITVWRPGDGREPDELLVSRRELRNL